MKALSSSGKGFDEVVDIFQPRIHADVLKRGVLNQVHDGTVALVQVDGRDFKGVDAKLMHPGGGNLLQLDKVESALLRAAVVSCVFLFLQINS